MKTDDAKLLAHIWAERLTDSLRLLIFGQPPEFSRDTQFGAALDTLHETAAFDRLPVELREALTSFPSLPPRVVPRSIASPGNPRAGTS